MNFRLVYVEFANSIKWTEFEDFYVGISTQKNKFNKISQREISC